MGLALVISQDNLFWRCRFGIVIHIFDDDINMDNRVHDSEQKGKTFDDDSYLIPITLLLNIVRKVQGSIQCSLFITTELNRY